MALVGVELETLVSEPDPLTTRPHHKNTIYYSTHLYRIRKQTNKKKWTCYWQ